MGAIFWNISEPKQWVEFFRLQIIIYIVNCYNCSKGTLTKLKYCRQKPGNSTDNYRSDRNFQNIATNMNNSVIKFRRD